MITFKEYSKEYFLTDYKMSSWPMKLLKYIKAVIEFFFVDYIILVDKTNKNSDLTSVKSIFRDDYDWHFSVINNESSTCLKIVKKIGYKRRNQFKFNYEYMRTQLISRVDLSKLQFDSKYYIFHCVTEPVEYFLFCKAKNLGLKTIAWQHAYYQPTNLFFDRVFNKIFTDGYIYFSENVKSLIDNNNPIIPKYFKWFPPDNLTYDKKVRPLLLLDHPSYWKSNVMLVLLGILRGFKLRFHPKSTMLSKLFNKNPLVHGDLVVGYKTGFLAIFKERNCIVKQIDSPFGLFFVMKTRHINTISEKINVDEMNSYRLKDLGFWISSL